MVGITCGDLNGIGPEIIIKALSDNRIADMCVPVIFGSNKVFNFYRKSLQDSHFNFTPAKDFSRLNPKQANLINCWEEEVKMTPGELNETGGTYAAKSLLAAAKAVQDGFVDVLVTAPVNKKNIHGETFPYTGHTPFLKDYFKCTDVLMFMASEEFRVGVVTEHLPLKDVASAITREAILSKLKIMEESLRTDFNVQKPKIAVLALNPHAGDNGLVGSEEVEIIRPAIKEAKHQMIVEGPFAADGFFARGYQMRFDGVLAMYHDQGLIPFKSLTQDGGINYTAGLPFVRTSPDHGTAFDIAGKGTANPDSFIDAIFEGIEIFKNREFYNNIRKNPLKRTYVAPSSDE